MRPDVTAAVMVSKLEADARPIAEPKGPRALDYALFRQIARGVFKSAAWDWRHHRMKARHGFYVADGGRSGADARLFEVYYGSRQLRGAEDFSNPRLEAEAGAPVEEGAALCYRQGDDGAVTVTLLPARRDGVKAEEDAIQLAHYADPAALTGRGELEMHFGALRAYAEATSVDGAPTWAQRLRVAALRFSKTTERDGRRLTAPIWGAAAQVATIAAAVLAGGALL